MSDKEQMISRAKEILASHGIKLNVWGCSCCESPWVWMQYNGEDVLFSTGRDGETTAIKDASFEMFE